MKQGSIPRFENREPWATRQRTRPHPLDSPLLCIELFLGGQITHPSKTAKGGAPVYNRVGVVKRHLNRRKVFDFPFVGGFGFGVAFVFAHSTKARFQESCGGRLVPPTIYPVSRLLIMIRCSDSPTSQGGKAPNQADDELLLHQGAPRAALHANQLRVTGLAAQHPVHAHRQLSGDRNLGHAAAPAQLQSLIVLP